MRRISEGDIVFFKSIYKIGLDDLIARKEYSKYMLVIKIIHDMKPKAACKVLCANGEINWVAMERIELLK